MHDLTPKEMGRRKFLKATGVALGVVGGYLIVQGVESGVKNGKIMGVLEKIIENRDNSNFRELQGYQIGTQYYTAKPFDNYAKIISEDVKENPFLNKMDGSDLRKFYRDFLNEGKDMQIGSKYKIPVWKKE